MTDDETILTFSHGGISCTLAGIDEPFEAMRAIADHLRERAADPRHGGADAPPPDLVTIAGIAGRVLGCRIEAQAHEGRIVLRVAGAPAARVLKIRRATFEAARAAGLSDAAGALPPRPSVAADDTPLSPGQEADLQRELALIDAERAARPAADAPLHTGSAGMPLQGDPGHDPERIRDKADPRMATPGPGGQRNTIAQMRAALAASRAEGDTGGLMRDGDKGPLRGDLATAAHHARNVSLPSLPLVLVPEQRVEDK